MGSLAEEEDTVDRRYFDHIIMDLLDGSPLAGSGEKNGDG